jgi:hypothetical protein
MSRAAYLLCGSKHCSQQCRSNHAFCHAYAAQGITWAFVLVLTARVWFLVCLQDHYDFGMRALKSVLVMAGSLKRANPDLPEDIVLIRAMRDSNLPKFLVADVELFCNIIGDLFPGVQVPDQVSLEPAESLLPLAKNSNGPGACWFDAVEICRPTGFSLERAIRDVQHNQPYAVLWGLCACRTMGSWSRACG